MKKIILILFIGVFYAISGQMIFKDKYVNAQTIVNSYRFTPTSSGISTDSLVAYYPFNGNANDESGNGNNGTVNGATLTTDRKSVSNAAYLFDGNDYISTLFKFNYLTNLDTFSISSWVYLSNKTGQKMVLAQNSVINGYEGYGLDWASDNIRSVIDAGAVNVDGIITSQDLTLNTWYHIVIVVEGNTMSMYVNGSFLTSDALSGIMTPSSSYFMYIGVYNYSGGNLYHFIGKIDDIRIYDRVLTTDEITLLYNE